MSPRLAHLAMQHGIALEYHDVWGHSHRAPETSVVALLEAMGVWAGSAKEIEASIAFHGANRWRTVVEPALVVFADESQRTIRLRLPAELELAELLWTADEEGGERHAGSFIPAQLGTTAHATIGAMRFDEREWVLSLPLPPGYHRLTIAHAEAVLGTCVLIAAPRTCHRPAALDAGGRVWGAAVQLYGVRSGRNWGIGDFSDLRTIVEQWGGLGAGFVGLSPLHALFPHDATRASPYSPSSRLFKNPLCIDVEAVVDFNECEAARQLVRSHAFQTELDALRSTEFVDYPAVAAAKHRVLELLFPHFRERHLDAGTPRARSFRAFQHAGGTALRGHALFEAIQEHFHRADPSTWGWPVWPEPYRDPNSPQCAAFAAAHAARVEFFEYLQWLADEQLARVAQSSADVGLGVGLGEDLAISVDRSGAEAWTNQQLYAINASIGAPPDEFSPNGQDWGLPPLVPARLRAAAYAPFIATLRANMRHAGALRIDHVMGLARLYWVPDGAGAAEGAYVQYPLADLLGIVALESHRNGCVVIGEDLGTVPDEVRTALGASGVLSYRLLYFERDATGDMAAPGAYPTQALVAASTHDLPTLAGWWAGHDIALRAGLHLLPGPARDAQVLGRAQDRARLLLALEREGLLPPGASVNPVSLPEMTPEFARSIEVFLARTAAQIMVVQFEDVLGLREQANLPGTVSEHPNWRRKLPLTLEEWPADDRFVALARALAAVRGGTRPRRDGGARTATAVIPRTTYRLQLHRDFRFADATAIVPYLAKLGVSHVYCSPYLRARAGSQHGYDIVDHAALNPEIGTRDDFDRFVATLKSHGMGQIADVVPNHMAVMGADNVWWMDVLENGPASAHATYFDIDWYPIDPTLAGKVLVPVLGDHYGHVLERGELVLTFEASAGSLALKYHEHRFPIDPREYPRILARVPPLLAREALPAQAYADFESLIAALGRLPARDLTSAEALVERRRDADLHKRRLAQIVREHPALAEAIARVVRTLNGTAGERASYQRLDALLEAQAYRLAYWRVAADEINYRRFFHINELAALRIENAAVFESTHRLVLELAAEGIIDGLRIDHPDGLYEPAEYFRRIQEEYARLVGASPHEGRKERPLYVVIEKIIAPHEQLPPSWPVHGTTGYRFSNVVNGLFVDTAARSRVDRAWRAFVRDEAVDFGEAAYRGKRLVMKTALAGELAVLANQAVRIARTDWRTRDFTLNSLRQAIAEVVACFPVYRTYIADGVSTQDEHYVQWAVTQAKRRSTAADLSVFDFVTDVLLARPPADATQDQVREYRRFAMRAQQFTAPVMAKGVEDTSFYVFNRLLSLNDVGSDPDDFGTTVAAFHDASADRATKWPHTMLATSTHDSKRSEDVRARIDVISELPAAWRLAVRRWSRTNRSRKRKVDGRPAPSPNDEYHLYQTLAGTFPAGEIDESTLEAYRLRIDAYMQKAVREAKVQSSWINPNDDYESAIAGFVQGLLGRVDGNVFLDDFRAQLRPLVWFGALNTISMALVKFSSPGVPDIYQGHEGIALTLVDPDNRRAVDYGRRRDALYSLEVVAAGPADLLPARVQALLDTPEDGMAKLWTTWRILSLRRRQPEVFESGGYRPVVAAGAQDERVVAYSRRFGSNGIVAVAGRLFAGLGLDVGVAPVGKAAWGDTTLDLSFIAAGTPLTNVLSGEVLVATGGAMPLAQVLANFPAALLAYQAT
ncbi:MAG: malto-oligosyltrehalose synthase [Casimicrobiaceae bacterium]